MISCFQHGYEKARYTLELMPVIPVFLLSSFMGFLLVEMGRTLNRTARKLMNRGFKSFPGTQEENRQFAKLSTKVNNS